MTPKPRAVINPDYTLDHYELDRVGANYIVASPSTRGMTPKLFSFSCVSSTVADYHGETLRITDSSSQSIIFEFNQSSTDVTGRKVESNSNRITVGISGETAARGIASQLKTTIENAISFTYVRYITVSVSNADITINTIAPYIGSSIAHPYTDYGAFNVEYNGGAEISDITTTAGSNDNFGNDPIQPPFSLGSKILRGSW